MERISANDLANAGCGTSLIQRCTDLLSVGNEEACLRMLRAHRCDLVEAMHEAQRPIDVCDWIISKVEAQHA